jgi:hypothetical protein
LPIGPDLDTTDRPTPPLTGVLLALAILAGAVWLRGGVVADTLRLDAGAGATVHFFSGQGSFAAAVTTSGEYFKDKKTWWQYAEARPPVDFRARWANLVEEKRFDRHGFIAIREPGRGTVGGLLVPLAPVSAALGAVALARVAWYRLFTRRRRRILAGMCPGCGNPTPGMAERCGNCGRRTRLRIDRPRNADAPRKAA